MLTFLRTLTPARLLGLGRPADAPPTPAQTEANLRHLVWEIAWFGVVWGSVIAFLQVYIVRLGASSLLVGALTYGPALIGVFWQIPAARLMTRTGWRMRWVISSGFGYRLIFLAVALVPFVLRSWLAEATAAIWVLSALVTSISNVAFLSMMADAVPTDRMTQVVGWRMAAFGLTNTLATLAGGQLLGYLPFPRNYQALFLIGFVASLISFWHIHQIHVPDPPPDPSRRPAFWRDLRRMLRFPGFGRYVTAVGMLQLAIGMSSPLLPLYWVRRLDASDAQVSVVLTIASAALVLGSLLMRRAIRKIGRELALAAGASGYALYPLLTSFSPSVWWLIPWAALGGFFNAAIAITLFDNLVAVTPDADRTNYIGLYNVFTNIALFAGPLLAGVLAASPGGPALGLRVAGATGLLAGVLFVLRVRNTVEIGPSSQSPS